MRDRKPVAIHRLILICSMPPNLLSSWMWYFQQLLPWQCTGPQEWCKNRQRTQSRPHLSLRTSHPGKVSTFILSRSFWEMLQLVQHAPQCLIQREENETETGWRWISWKLWVRYAGWSRTSSCASCGSVSSPPCEVMWTRAFRQS